MDIRLSFLSFIMLYLYCIVHAERTRDKMYLPIKGASCFRRLNATHQTGCTSPSSGAVGVLHVIKTIEDIEFLVKDPPSPPYTAILPAYMFSRQNVMRLRNDAAKYIAAIVLIKDNTLLTNFTHEEKCPNRWSGLVDSGTCDPNKPETTWNPAGTGLLHEDFPFPIYYVSDHEEIEKLVNCFETFNNFAFEAQASRALCSIQIKSFMSAAVNSEVCIRRTNYINNLSPTRYCDPLSGRNVYATLFPLEMAKRDEKFILVTARMDTTSMFDGVGLGAKEGLLPFATLVSVAHTLTHIIRKEDKMHSTHNVLFVVFNGEAYDYIGSQRFVYDLQQQSVNTKGGKYLNVLKFENIDLLIDIGLLDDMSSISIYHTHNFPQVQQLQNMLQNYSRNLNYDISVNITETLNLPPTSAQSFVRQNINFPAVVLSSKPQNQFYHSIYDDENNIRFEYKNTTEDFTVLETKSHNDFPSDSVQTAVRNMSTVLAQSLYQMVTKKTYHGEHVANAKLVDEFLYCFLQSADCPLFKAASFPDSLPGAKEPPIRYISVKGSISAETAIWTHRLLGLLVSHKQENVKKEDCGMLPLSWVRGYSGQGECHLTTQNYTAAYSPAFLSEDYDWKSGKYSTWTESTWMQLSARIFLRPSRSHEAVTLAVGFVVMAISFVIVFLINSRSNVLFGNSTSTSPVTEPAAC